MGVERQKTVYLVSDDTGPPLAVRFNDLDLANYSPITMEIKYDDGTTISRTVTPDATDPELGSVAWSAGDLVVGTHEAEFQLTQILDSTVLTLPRRYPVLLDIREDLT